MGLTTDLSTDYKYYMFPAPLPLPRFAPYGADLHKKRTKKAKARCGGESGALGVASKAVAALDAQRCCFSAISIAMAEVLLRRSVDAFSGALWRVSVVMDWQLRSDHL